MGKIRLKCQIADLKTEVTCYVIENETSNSPGKAAINILANGIFNFAPVFQVRWQERSSTKSLCREEAGGWSLLLGRKYARFPEDAENEAEAHLEEVEAVQKAIFPSQWCFRRKKKNSSLWLPNLISDKQIVCSLLLLYCLFLLSFPYLHCIMTSSIIAIRYCKEKNERYRRKVALANKESASYAEGVLMP